MTPEIAERGMNADELGVMRAGFARHDLALGMPVGQDQARHGFVAAVDGRMVGCSSGLTDGDWFCLTDLWVDENCRNLGLGAALLERLEARVRGLGIFQIYTWTVGEDALRFYRRRGYADFVRFDKWHGSTHARYGLRKHL